MNSVKLILLLLLYAAAGEIEYRSLKMTQDNGMTGDELINETGNMKTSRTISVISAALGLAQAEMGGAHKEANNPFFKSTYADLASVIKAIKEPFAHHGLAFVQCPTMSSNSVGVTTRILHKSGEWIESTLMLPVLKMDAQSAGSCLTYAKRYSLQAMSGVPSQDDDGEMAMSREIEQINEASAGEIKRLLESTNSDVQKFCAVFRIDSVDAMPKSQYARAVAMLNKKAKK